MLLSSPSARLRRRLTLAVAIALAGCKGGADADDRAAAPSDSAPAVVGARTALATERPFTETLGATGTVAARPGHAAALSAPGPTRVARVNVSVGSRVTPGQALVELDRTLFAAQAGGADAALTAARLGYERAKRLADEGVSPRKDAEQAAATLAQARAAATEARRAESLGVLRSPIAGVVTSVSAVLGASVDANQTLVEVADPTALDVLLTVTPADAARIRPGAAVALTAGQAADGDSLGTGRVAGIGAAVDSASRGVQVRVVTPALARALRIGETVYGSVALATRAAAVVVPPEALVPAGDGFRVFVVDATGTAHARDVKVGARTSDAVEILDGLKAGERVVTYGAFGVDDGVKITAVKP